MVSNCQSRPIQSVSVLHASARHRCWTRPARTTIPWGDRAAGPAGTSRGATKAEEVGVRRRVPRTPRRPCRTTGHCSPTPRRGAAPWRSVTRCRPRRHRPVLDDEPGRNGDVAGLIDQAVGPRERDGSRAGGLPAQHGLEGILHAAGAEGARVVVGPFVRQQEMPELPVLDECRPGEVRDLRAAEVRVVQGHERAARVLLEGLLELRQLDALGGRQAPGLQRGPLG